MSRVLLPLFVLLGVAFTIGVVGVHWLRSPSEEPIQPPRINFFAASPEGILEGEFTRLHYSVQNASTIIIDHGVLEKDVAGEPHAMGDVAVSPSRSTTYTLEACNRVGCTTATARVIVNPRYETPAEDRPRLISPANGRKDVPVRYPDFSWYPFGNATLYEFILAEDPLYEFFVGGSRPIRVIKQITLSDTVYRYSGNLKYATDYFWAVRALKPVTSPWSDVWIFCTEPEPRPR